MNIPLVIYWCWTHHSPSHGMDDRCRLVVLIYAEVDETAGPHETCEVTPAVVAQVAHG